MKIKLCGFKEIETLKTAIETKCDFIGFIFCEKSPRFINVLKAAEISQIIPQDISKVAVIVDADFDFLTEIANKFKPEFFQFHGNEDVEYLKKAKETFPNIKIIKAIKVEDENVQNLVETFQNHCDQILFDNKTAGSGQKFDWKYLQNIITQNDFFLSGGLNIDNIDEAIKVTNAKMIDISSGIEEIRGEKSAKSIIEFMNKVKNYQ